MNLSHPALRDMIKLGCKSQVKTLLAFQTFLELCEVHKAQEVTYHYSPDLDLVYLVASFNGTQEVYVSMSHTESISTQKIKAYQKYLLKDTEDKTFYLVLRDVDTSCIIYKISDGLIKPSSLEVAKEKKDLKEKRMVIDTEIYNSLPKLIVEAKSSQSNVGVEK